MRQRHSSSKHKPILRPTSVWGVRLGRALSSCCWFTAGGVDRFKQTWKLGIILFPLDASKATVALKQLWTDWFKMVTLEELSRLVSNGHALHLFWLICFRKLCQVTLTNLWRVSIYGFVLNVSALGLADDFFWVLNDIHIKAKLSHMQAIFIAHSMNGWHFVMVFLGKLCGVKFGIRVMNSSHRSKAWGSFADQCQSVHNELQQLGQLSSSFPIHQTFIYLELSSLQTLADPCTWPVVQVYNSWFAKWDLVILSHH